MIARPRGVGAFQFVVLAALRAAQLMRGCRPKVDGEHKATVIAQLEVSEGKVMPVLTVPEMNSEPTAIDALSDNAPPVRPAQSEKVAGSSFDRRPESSAFRPLDG